MRVTKRSPRAQTKVPKSKSSAVEIAARRVLIAELEQRIVKLELRDEALDHSIEELAAAWAAESK